jgi:preprotein translocase SecE subunit
MGKAMLMGIYKPGQGYWVRVLTAIGAAVSFGACALWAWQQGAAVPIPTPTHLLTLGELDGTIAVNDRVTLRADGASGTLEDIGFGVVDAVGDGQGDVTIRDVSMSSEERQVSDTVSIGLESGESARVTSRRAIPIFEVLYVQAGIAGVIILVGAVVTYYFVGTNKKSSEFLIATDNEMKKVNWSTWKDVRGSTVVVIAAAFLMAAGLFMVDFGFGAFFRWVGVLSR